MNTRKSQLSRERLKISRKRRRRRKAKKYLLSLVLVLGCFMTVCFLGEQILTARSAFPLMSFSEQAADISKLYSKYVILEDLASGEVLAEKRSQEKIYPASLTKIMTAIVAIENIENLEEILAVPYEIFPDLYAQEASMAGFESGEEVTVLDLLYGVLLPSGAECCLTLANRIAGSEAAFAELMNQKAQELGMKDTHFCNSTGLHEEKHYSTAKDIAVLLRYALGNSEFRTVFTSVSYNVQPTNVHPEGFTFSSTLFKDMNNAQIMDSEIMGGKTGYTKEAGLCLASLALVEGQEYILITAKANGTHETEPFHILDAVKVYDQLGT